MHLSRSSDSLLHLNLVHRSLTLNGLDGDGGGLASGFAGIGVESRYMQDRTGQGIFRVGIAERKVAHSSDKHNMNLVTTCYLVAARNTADCGVVALRGNAISGPVQHERTPAPTLHDCRLIGADPVGPLEKKRGSGTPNEIIMEGI